MVNLPPIPQDNERFVRIDDDVFFCDCYGDDSDTVSEILAFPKSSFIRQDMINAAFTHFSKLARKLVGDVQSQSNDKLMVIDMNKFLASQKAANDAWNAADEWLKRRKFPRREPTAR